MSPLAPLSDSKQSSRLRATIAVHKVCAKVMCFLALTKSETLYSKSRANNRISTSGRNTLGTMEESQNSGGFSSMCGGSRQVKVPAHKKSLGWAKSGWILPSTRCVFVKFRPMEETG